MTNSTFLHLTLVSTGRGRTTQRVNDCGHYVARSIVGNRHDIVRSLLVKTSNERQKEIAKSNNFAVWRQHRRDKRSSSSSSLSIIIIREINSQFIASNRRRNARLSDKERVTSGKIHQ